MDLNTVLSTSGIPDNATEAEKLAILHVRLERMQDFKQSITSDGVPEIGTLYWDGRVWHPVMQKHLWEILKFLVRYRGCSVSSLANHCGRPHKTYQEHWKHKIHLIEAALLAVGCPLSFYKDRNSDRIEIE